ncbi:MAG: lamin tail domain-containing protein, partial [Gemmatimonadaceae bacterium]|nr:lamin tail domain-containing protein [Gemmatimonadaceae bacterium]
MLRVVRARLALTAACLAMAGACRGDRRVASEAGGGVAPRVAIDEIMIDPRMVSDASGEWFEVVNYGESSVSLRGWTITSANDAPRRIDAAVSISPGGYAVLAANADPARNGGVRATWAYGGEPRFANGADWLALHDARRTLVDSIAWRSAVPGVSWELDDPRQPHASVAPP